MKTIKALLLTVSMTSLLVSCGNNVNENPTGSWTSATPESITTSIAGATSASKIVDITFNAPSDNNTSGEVVLSAQYDVTAPIATDSVSVESTYKVNASIKGTWTKEAGEDDEYLLTFDSNTLAVNGVDAPELGPVTDDFLSSLSKYTKIDDVEVSKDGTHMSFETKNPKTTYQFVKK